MQSAKMKHEFSEELLGSPCILIAAAAFLSGASVQLADIMHESGPWAERPVP